MDRLNMTAIIVPIVLNRINYDNWSSRIKSYLLAEDLWDIVEGADSHEDESHEDEPWRKKNVKALNAMKNVKALNAIKNSCGNETYKIIKDTDSAKEAWEMLKTLKRKYNQSSSKGYRIDTRTILQAYSTDPDEANWTPTDLDDWPELAMEEGRSGGLVDESNENNENKTRFVNYVNSKHWYDAIEFLRHHPQVGSARISSDGTALHQAVQPFSKCSMHFMEELVGLMEREDLAIQDGLGRTALLLLIREYPEMVEIAELMVAKNENLLTILPSGSQEPLVVEAERQEKGERMARYLYSLTKCETLRVTDGAQLISLGFRLKRFDIAWDLIQRYPQLIVAKDYDGDIFLVTLASNRLAFLSGSRLSLWQNLIYHGIHIKPLPSINESYQSDQRPLSNQKENQRHLISSGLFRGLVMNLQKLLGINRIYEMKLMHARVDQLLSLMCKAKKYMSDIECLELQEAVCVAAERGHVEYIFHLYKELRDGLFELEEPVNPIGQSLFHIAAECRHHNLYNLIYFLCDLIQEQDKDKYGQNRLRRIQQDIVGRIDYFGNNMVHTVASITSLSKIDHIQGAALQMQRELQWFKEVESVADSMDRESLNFDNMTPHEVFKENHKDLAKEAEKSMKETATSCTVVAALIVTIMFAAALTIPGGNDETCLPKFSTKKVFVTFIVSDVISLFASTTSVIMFLGILTSRYSEDDFLKSLPTKMIIGLFTLFVSITTMMIVFSCAIYIMLDGKISVVISSILLANVPVIAFIWMQFPLFVEFFISTFGRGIFDGHKEN